MKRKISTFTYLVLLMSFSGIVVAANFQSAGASSVEGVVTSDTVWTLTNSPYEVVSDVTIINGARLTIEPGVEIRFETGSSLIVNGSLHAIGTRINRIRFTSNESKPMIGDWNGIKLYGENSTLTMDFCDVEYAKNGITVDSLGSAVIENSIIRNNSLSGINAIGIANLLIRKNKITLNTDGISSSGVTCSQLKIINNSISNNENGVNLFAYGDDSRIHNVAISGNCFNNNTNGISLHSSTRRARAYINNIEISNNMVRSSEYGIYLFAEGWGGPSIEEGVYIYNSTISGNNISFSKNALYVDSSSNWYSWISGLTISRNIIHSSKNGVFMHAFRTPQAPYQNVPFDVILFGNTVSANNKGVSILGDVRANFTQNSVAYNSYGLYLVSSVPSENLACNNDIYRNTAYGIYIEEEVSIDAKHNFWGESSGPYHETRAPFGEGDRVNGDEEDIDFIPFSTEPFGVLNNAPIAVLKTDKTTANLNQTVIFDGFKSLDYSSIIKYFFDFGDGTTAQVSSASISHKYSSVGTFNANLVVMDDLGVNSTNTAMILMIVTAPPSLVVSVFPNPLSVISEGPVMVEVCVSNGSVGVVQAFVKLTSEGGGSFEQSSGYTDSNGDFNSTYFAPRVSEPTTLRITATALKEGYENGSADAYLQVLAPPPDGIRLDSPQILFATLLVAIIVAVVVRVVVKRRRNGEFRGREAGRSI